MRVEHHRALAALAQLRAEILVHEAELEAMTNHIRMHEAEMSSHHDAMHHHEEHGHGNEHDQLKQKHNKIMLTHNELAKMMESEGDHHRPADPRASSNLPKNTSPNFHSHGSQGNDVHAHDDHAHDDHSNHEKDDGGK